MSGRYAALFPVYLSCLALVLTMTHSLCCGMVCCVFLQFLPDPSFSLSHGFARLSLNGNADSDSPMASPALQTISSIVTYHSSRFLSNRLLLSPPSHSTPADSVVEWAYAFDVHTNAFFPLYLTLYLAQLFLLPIVLKDNWVCFWVGNTLYLAAYAPFSY